MNENKIKKSLDAIEPEVGAKERMYQNILKKAQVEPPAKKKRQTDILRYALPIAACLCLLVAGAVHFASDDNKADLSDDFVLSGNPFTEVESPESFKELGITLEAPTDATDVSYSVIDNEIAAIGFTLNGKTFEVRASAQSGDFSGLTGEVLETESIDADNSAMLYLISGDTGEYYKLTWTNGKVNYCLYGTDGADRIQLLFAYEAVI